MDFSRLASLILSGDFTNTEIGRQCGVYRGSVPKFRKRLLDAGLTSTKLPSYSEDEIRSIIRPQREAVQCSRFEDPNWDSILQELGRPGATQEFLYEEYKKTSLRPMSAATFRRRLHKLRKKRGPILRTQHTPGYQIFVDFAGKRPSFVDPLTGAQIKVELFVACAGHSKLAFAYATGSQTGADLIRAHVAMFEYYGGVSRYITSDNLKAAVITPRGRRERVILNPQYSTMLRHYGCDALPARPRAPTDKGLVENSVLHLTRWITYPLSRERFTSLQEINDAIVPLLERINNKPMRRAGHLSRRALFEQEERRHLRDLPTTPFRGARHLGTRVVPEDYHLMICGTYYSVPHSLIGKKVEVFEALDAFEIYSELERIAVHLKAGSQGQVCTIPSHMPANHQIYASHRHRHFSTWGDLQAKPIRDYLRAHLRCWKNPNATENASKRLRQLQDQYGTDSLEAAVGKVMDLMRSDDGDVQAHLHVRRIQGLLNKPATLLLTKDGRSEHSSVEHENIRGAEYYG